MSENASGNFRGSIFGGFKRADVVEYIKNLSVEMDECRRQRESYEQRCCELEEQLSLTNENTEQLKRENTELSERVKKLEYVERKADELQNELDSISEAAKAYEETKIRLAELEVAAVRRAAEIEKRARDSSEATLDETDKLISDINDRYGIVKSDIEETIAHLRGELEKISTSLADLVLVLDASADELLLFKDRAFEARSQVLEEDGDRL